ncbi:hypothetical protein SAMN04487828_1287 [Prevotella sp. lc2012]|nr:hypothetical protein SAMN04487828_1287 [Prevotella sp. lc2012]
MLFYLCFLRMCYHNFRLTAPNNNLYAIQLTNTMYKDFPDSPKSRCLNKKEILFFCHVSDFS